MKKYKIILISVVLIILLITLFVAGYNIGKNENKLFTNEASFDISLENNPNETSEMLPRPYPQDFIKEEWLKNDIVKDKIIIDVSKINRKIDIGRVKGTHSMEPVLGKNATMLYFIP